MKSMNAINRFVTLFLCILIVQTASAHAAEMDMKLTPESVPIGGVAALIVHNPPSDDSLSVVFNDKKAYFYEYMGAATALIGVDVSTKPGRRPIFIKWKENGEWKKITLFLTVTYADYGTRSIQVDPRQVKLSSEDLERARKEKKLVGKALSVRSGERLWERPFIRPVDGDVISAFGKKTIINGQMRKNPHTGVDFRGATGTPVKAPASGKVLLTGDHFFAGGSVYIDHGQGVISMYFHLSEISVKNDDIVAPGQLIGKVGATGRVTGPHLHYGIYLNSARISPLKFHELTENLDAYFNTLAAKKTETSDTVTPTN